MKVEEQGKQINAISNDLTGIKRDVEHLVKTVDKFTDQIDGLRNHIDGIFVTQKELSTVIARVTKLEGNTTWGLRIIVGAFLTTVVGYFIRTGGI